jgi:hypothetical protein
MCPYQSRFQQLRSFHEDRFHKYDLFLGFLGDRVTIEAQYAAALKSLGTSINKTLLPSGKSDDAFEQWVIHFVRVLDIRAEHYAKFAKDLADAKEQTIGDFLKKSKASFANVCRDLTAM